MSDGVLMHKRIDVDASPVLYDRPFTPESLAEDWEVRSATWHCDVGGAGRDLRVIRIRRLAVREIVWARCCMAYQPEFQPGSWDAWGTLASP